MLAVHRLTVEDPQQNVKLNEVPACFSRNKEAAQKTAG